MSKSVGYAVAGTGPAVILLHSSMSSKTQWRDLVQRCQADCRLIAIDLHGYGESSEPHDPANYALIDEIELVRSVLAEELGTDEPFHLVGHSFGGAVGLRLASLMPQRVLSMALYEPVAFFLLNDRELLSEVHSLVQAMHVYAEELEPAGAAQIFIDYWNGCGAFEAFPARVQDEMTSRVIKVRDEFRALTEDRMNLEACRGLAMPVLLMCGEESPMPARTIVEELAATLPQGEAVQVAAGHMAPLTHPEIVNPVIMRFLARQLGLDVPEQRRAA